MYPELSLYIAGRFVGAEGRRTQAVNDPATLQPLGRLPWAEAEDVEAAVQAAHAAFAEWRRVSPVERSDLLRRVAALARERAPEIGHAMTMDNGKPLADAVAEVLNAAEHVEWHAEAGQAVYSARGRPLIQPQPIELLHLIEWEIRAFDRRFAGTRSAARPRCCPAGN